nr:hypothetical protein [Micromonospora sp. DSM 115978]
MNRDRSPLAGQTVRIKADSVGIGGQECIVEDWWINAAGGSWMFANGNPAALKYAFRSALAGLPIDDEVLYGKVDGLDHLVHVSEIEADGGASS